MADDLNRWLRMVRPPTAADDDWTNSSEAADALTAIHRRTRPHGVRFSLRTIRPHAWMPAAAVAAIAALVAAVAVNAPEPSGSRTEALTSPKIRPVANYLEPFSSCDDLLKGLRKQASAHITAAGWSPQRYYAYAKGVADGSMVLDSTASLGGPNSQLSAGQLSPVGAASGTSATNVQEVGIDEPDIVKTDDGRVIIVVNGTLRVIDASSRAVTANLSLKIYSGWQNAQLLVSGDHALVILTEPFGSDGLYGLRTGLAAPGLPQGGSNVLFVDLTGTPKVTSTLHMDGQFVDARMVGSTARLVTTSQPNIAFPYGARTAKTQRASNRAAIAKAPLSAWLPSYTITQGTSTQTRTVPCSQVSHPTDYTGASMVTVYTVDPGAPGKDPVPISVAADGDTVYATDSSLYVASNPQWWSTSRSKNSTQIHRFDISGTGSPTYLGSGKVPGRLLSQYSLSDYQSQLRVATQNGRASSVYVLDAATLAVTGHVDNIGRGEQLYAVRFLGPLAYVVTFFQSDPLFVVDLRDPAHPKVAGELKVNGFSTYLHDAGNGRIIGVGQDGGLQVALYDVSNPEHPTRTGQVVLKGRYGGERLDPHAFLYWQPSGLISVPALGRSRAEALVVRVHGGTLEQQGVVSNTVGSVARSLIVDGNLWTLSEGGIRVSDPVDLAKLNWIDFS